MKSRLPIGLPGEQFRGIGQRHRIGVEKDHLLEAAMGDGVRLERPRSGDDGRIAMQHGLRIDHLDALLLQQELHRLAHLVAAEMPDLNWQLALVNPQQRRD